MEENYLYESETYKIISQLWRKKFKTQKAYLLKY